MSHKTQTGRPILQNKAHSFHLCIRKAICVVFKQFHCGESLISLNIPVGPIEQQFLYDQFVFYVALHHTVVVALLCELLNGGAHTNDSDV